MKTIAVIDDDIYIGNMVEEVLPLAVVGIPTLGTWRMDAGQLLLFANMIYNSLEQPEMTSGIVITANGIDLSEPAPNPNYVSGVTRAVYEFILDFLPTGQGALMAFLEIANPVRMMLSAVSAEGTAAAVSERRQRAEGGGHQHIARPAHAVDRDMRVSGSARKGGKVGKRGAVFSRRFA